MPRIGPWEMVIILAIVMIIFGVGKLPQVGGTIGKALYDPRLYEELTDTMANLQLAIDQMRGLIDSMKKKLK